MLGILPLGTANSFARALGIPLDLDGAAEVLTGGGKVADVDLGRINDDYFANTAAIGLPALVGRNMPHGLKRYFGKAGYILVGAVHFLRHKPFRVVLTDGRAEIARFDERARHPDRERPVSGRRQGRRRGQPRKPRPRDPHRQGRAQDRTCCEPGCALRLNHRAVDFTEIVRASDVVIETEPPHYVSIDGEVVTRTPVRVSVARQALMLMVPRAHEDVS